jgi:hypothetical protein
MMSGFNRHPNVSSAARVGDPTLNDPTPVSASDLVQRANRTAMGGATGGKDSLSVQTVNGTPPPNQAPPRSDAATADPAAADPNAAPAQPDPNELKPTDAAADPAQQATAPDPNELKPNAPADQPPPAPAQVNEIQQGKGGSNAQSASSNDSGQQLADDKDLASSKHKKKKGLLHKVIPGS